MCNIGLNRWWNLKMRKNNKNQILDYEKSIQKSNQLSMAKLSHGLTLNQLQLFSYAIYSTQQNGETEFHKADFERKFNLQRYKTEHAREDARAILNLKFSTEYLENDKFEYYNVFQFIKYDMGLFKFEWSNALLPHILELKEKYITTDLTITSRFKSAFSWTLYDYLKAHYGYWHKELSKEAILKLFGVEDKKAYIANTGDFKKKVLNFAIDELNTYTEFEVWYVEKKKGRAIIGFDLHWSVPSKQEVAATEKQLKEITTIIDAVEADMWNYLEVLEENDMEKLHLMNTIQKVLKCRVEATTTLTNTRAKETLQLLKAHLRSLESQLEDARRKKTLTSNPNYVPFYNWLEERE